MDLIFILTIISWSISFFLTIYVFYYIIVSLFSFKNIARRAIFSPKHKFAAIIAARNEAEVIGSLVQSLKMQNYPKELIDIIVIPNNCTDNTKDIALDSGAIVMECSNPVKSKGDVLSFVFNELLSDNANYYDAFCIFDADNLVHPDFMKEMNNALRSGTKVAQGYRDSKNPSDTWVSSCYSIYYWNMDRFFNNARAVLGSSVNISGTGFMIKADVLKNQGGWNTVTITEDLEFTAQCACNGIKIDWIPQAIVYDEQPVTFVQSWKQRTRWSAGLLQCFSEYFTKLGKSAWQNKSFACFDMMLFFLSPIMQVLGIVSFLCTTILNLSCIYYQLFPVKNFYYIMFLSANYTYFSMLFVAFITVIIERKSLFKTYKGIFTFWLFFMSWIPINIMCVLNFKKPIIWDEIKHTRRLEISEVMSYHNQ